MANDTALLSTVSSVLEDAVTSNETITRVFSYYPIPNLWQYGWPPLCVTGLVGNTLVLLVLRRDGLVRTSANVYLSTLAVVDSLVLIFVSVLVYPFLVWGFRFDSTSSFACYSGKSIHIILSVGSVWISVAFTAERCVAVHYPLLKLRLCTPHNAGLCCVSLLVLAFVNDIDQFFDDRGDVVCVLRDWGSYYNYKMWFNVVVKTIIPTCVVLFCNWAIIRTLRRKLMQAAVHDSVTRTTFMCMGVSFAFIVCVVPVDLFSAIHYYEYYWPMAVPDLFDVIWFLLLLRYANHAINFFLYSLTGAHFRRELVALFRSCTQRRCAAAAVVRRMPSRVTSRFKFRQGIDDDIEMR